MSALVGRKEVGTSALIEVYQQMPALVSKGKRDLGLLESGNVLLQLGLGRRVAAMAIVVSSHSEWLASLFVCLFACFLCGWNE